MSDCCEITPVLALKLPVDSILLRSLPSGRLSWDKAHAAATLVGAESTSDSSVRFTCCTSTGADLAILSWWKGMEMTTFCRDISAFHSLELHSSKYIYIYLHMFSLVSLENWCSYAKPFCSILWLGSSDPSIIERSTSICKDPIFDHDPIPFHYIHRFIQYRNIFYSLSR